MTTATVVAFLLGALCMFAVFAAYLYRAMYGEISDTPDQHASDDSYHPWVRGVFAPVVMTARAERAGDLTFHPVPADTPTSRPLSDFLGEQLVFEAICGARNLHSVFVAYALADASQRRACTRDERMFYDACLGTAVRVLIDEHRARTPEPETQAPDATPAHLINTSRH